MTEQIHPIHTFRHEAVSYVPGYVPDENEVVTLSKKLKTERPLTRDLWRSYTALIERELTETDRKLLQELDLTPIVGLPGTTAQDQADYVEHYCIATDTSASDLFPAQTVITSPHGGRAGILHEGWITGTGKVTVIHDIKGLGPTSRTPLSIKQGPGEKGGIMMFDELVDDIAAYVAAVDAGVLVPLLLPPVFYREFLYNGQRYKAEDYLPGEQLLAHQRAWSSDHRTSELFSRGRANMLTVLDRPEFRDVTIQAIYKEPQLNRELVQVKVGGFIEDATTIRNFNRIHNTAYYLGCERYMTGLTYNDYTRGFQIQNAENVARMLQAGIIRTNLIPQNISLAGEWGDWDTWEKINHRTKNGRSSFINNIAAVIQSAYAITSTIEAVIGEEEIGSCNDFWRLVCSFLPSGHYLKDLTLEELIYKYSQLGWQHDGKHMAEFYLKNLTQRHVQATQLRSIM